MSAQTPRGGILRSEQFHTVNPEIISTEKNILKKQKKKNEKEGEMKGVLAWLTGISENSYFLQASV